MGPPLRFLASKHDGRGHVKTNLGRLAMTLPGNPANKTNNCNHVSGDRTLAGRGSAKKWRRGMSVFLIGAMLLLIGVVYTAVQVLRRGPLSGETRESPRSLEPRRQGSVLGLRANWLGYVLIVIGAALLFVGVPA
jgi:hypothetical protein